MVLFSVQISTGHVLLGFFLEELLSEIFFLEFPVSFLPYFLSAAMSIFEETVGYLAKST